VSLASGSERNIMGADTSLDKCFIRFSPRVKSGNTEEYLRELLVVSKFGELL